MDLNPNLIGETADPRAAIDPGLLVTLAKKVDKATLVRILMQRLREKIVKLQIDRNAESDRCDTEGVKDKDSEVKRFREEVTKLEDEKSSLRVEAKKKEETRLQEIDVLGREVRRLQEEVVRLKAEGDQKKEEETKEKDIVGAKGDQRTEQTKDFPAHHSKSTSTDGVIKYLRGGALNETKETSFESKKESL